MSGPIVRKYGFPDHERIFGKREAAHGVEAPSESASKPEAQRAPEPSETATKPEPDSKKS